MNCFHDFKVMVRIHGPQSRLASRPAVAKESGSVLVKVQHQMFTRTGLQHDYTAYMGSSSECKAQNVHQNHVTTSEIGKHTGF